jgi:F-type H+-transporting ATPase subunit delta
MQATSRESLQTVRGKFDELVAGPDEASLRQLGDELASVTALLANERTLRRHLADLSTAESNRASLVDTLFGDKLSASTVDLLRDIAKARWSRSVDLLDAVELFARLAALAVAEREGSAEEVEDELFRFGRILESESKLAELLGDVTRQAEQRLQLLDGVLADKVKPTTRELLAQVVRAPRGRQIDMVVEQLAELAAARRDESVANVTSAAELSEEQERRLVDVLSRIYNRPISVRVEVDPDLVGGLVVRVGDEVIDGSIASRLSKARRQLLG